MRLLSVLCLIVLCSPWATAQEFMGRKVEITDARSDQAAAAPLVIAMHGFLGTSSSMRKKIRFDALARQHGFVVAYPNGVRRSWNDGRGSVKRVDDVAYLSALIAALVADGRADPARVFLAGHSNGGGMALRMACDRADLIAGIAGVQSVDRHEDGTLAKIMRYARCRAPLTYVLIEGHGHDWPGQGRRKTRLQGPATKEVDAAHLSWWFFSQL